MSLFASCSLAEKKALLSEQLLWLIAQAEAKGASAVRVTANAGNSVHVQTRLMQPENMEYSQNQAISIEVYYGQRVGTAATNCLDKSSLMDMLAAACAAARFIEPDPFAGLPDPALLVHPEQIPELDLFHPCPLEAEQLLDLCQVTEQAGFDYATAIVNSEGAACTATQDLHLLAAKSRTQTEPFMISRTSSNYGLHCTLLARQEQKNSDPSGADQQVGSWFDQTVCATDLAKPEHVGQQAAKRAVAALGARTIPTAQLPVLFDAHTARQLWHSLLKALSGKRIYEKSSFLTDALGKTILPASVHLSEQPFIPRSVYSAGFDAEGVATRAKSIVHAGILQTYLLSSYSGRMLQMPSTGNAGGVYNLVVAADTIPCSDLIKNIRQGLLVTDLMGQGVNLVTGNYSQGASGYWIEQGAICYPVHQVTIAGHLPDMLRQMIAFGDDIDTRTAVRTGSVLVDAMQVAGGMASTSPSDKNARRSR